MRGNLWENKFMVSQGPLGVVRTIFFKNVLDS